MKTSALQLRDYLKSLSQNKRLFFVARLLVSGGKAFADIYFFLVIVGIVGAIGIAVIPVAMNLPQVLGQILAQLCVEKNSCDFTLDMVSLFAGVYLLSAVVVTILSITHLGYAFGDYDRDNVLAYMSGKNSDRSFSLNELVDEYDAKREEMQSIIEKLIDDKEIVRLTATPFANEKYMVRLHETQ